MVRNYAYSVSNELGSIRAIILAVVVHAALFAFLWFGIHWQNQEPVAVEAEIWSPNIKEAAPQAPITAPQPTPESKPQLIVQETARPKVEASPVPDPEIALEKEKKRKEQARKEQARQEELEKQQRLQKQQAEQEKKDKLKTEQKVARKKEAVQEKQQQDGLKKEEADAADNKRYNDELKRMRGQPTSSGAANSTGTAAQSLGPRGDPSYGQKVGAKIKSNINFNVPDGLIGNPSVEFDAQLMPDGSVASLHLRKSSGVPGFDEAVKRAIEKSAPYPKDSKLGVVPPSFIGIHKPKDQ